METLQQVPIAVADLGREGNKFDKSIHVLIENVISGFSVKALQLPTAIVNVKELGGQFDLN